MGHMTRLKNVIGRRSHDTCTCSLYCQVCKHFLHAIEKGIYGWFWECPSGGDKCIYRHALPPGFVFKKAMKEEEEEEVISMEELVEKEVGV